MTTTTIAERVAAGAEWLDQHEPGWVERIDLDRLDLASACRCVLGQLDTYYYAAACYRLGIDTKTQAYQLGFNDADARFTHLTTAWRELIQQRRAEQ